MVVDDGCDRVGEARLMGGEDVVIDQDEPEPVFPVKPAKVDLVDEKQRRHVDAERAEQIDGLRPQDEIRAGNVDDGNDDEPIEPGARGRSL